MKLNSWDSFLWDYFLLDPDDDIVVMDEFDDIEVTGYESLPSVSGAHWGKIGPIGLLCYIVIAWQNGGCCQFCMQM